MARSYASLATAIWSDRGFRGLDPREQWAYLMLSTQPNITAAGTLPLTLHRWAQLAADGDADVLRAALRGLERAGWVVIDEDAQELLVLVPFIRDEKARRHAPKRDGPEGSSPGAVPGDSTGRARPGQAPRTSGGGADVASGRLRPTAIWRGSPTPKLRLDVYRRTGFACARCGLKFEVPEGYDGRYALFMEVYNSKKRRNVTWLLEIDHIHPYLLGGRYKRENLQALCTACNARKGARVT